MRGNLVAIFFLCSLRSMSDASPLATASASGTISDNSTAATAAEDRDVRLPDDAVPVNLEGFEWLSLSYITSKSIQVATGQCRIYYFRPGNEAGTQLSISLKENGKPLRGDRLISLRANTTEAKDVLEKTVKGMKVYPRSLMRLRKLKPTSEVDSERYAEDIRDCFIGSRSRNSTGRTNIVKHGRRSTAK